METLSDGVQRVARLVAPPDGPGPFVLGIDGRSGAGKSELAAALLAVLRRAMPEVEVGLLALEDAYHGWRGLADGVAEVAEGVLAPLAEGRPGGYRRYDWQAARLAEAVSVPPAGVPVPRVLVVEGCGAGAAVCAPYVHALVWLEAPEKVRRRRALDRDQHTWAALWPTWEAQENALLAERDARAAADMVLRTG